MTKSELKQKLLATELFIENNYFEIYLDLVMANLQTKKLSGKTQSHHILQRKWFNTKSISIDNSKDNLVNLLFKDHILAHYYLCKCTTTWLAKANTIALINMTSLEKNKQNVKLIMESLADFQTEYEKLKQAAWCNKIDKNELIKYYIIKNYSKTETAKHFNCCNSCIDRWLERYDIHKAKKQNRCYIDPMELANLYITKNYTLNSLCKKYNVSSGKLKEVLRKHNIKKGCATERVNKQRIKIGKEDFYRLYITENNSIAKLASLFKVSKTCIKQYLKKYNISKTNKAQIADAIRKGKTK